MSFVNAEIPIKQSVKEIRKENRLFFLIER